MDNANSSQINSEFLESLKAEASASPGGVDLKNRNHKQFEYRNCFVGKDLVKWLKNNGQAPDEFSSTALAQSLMDQGLIFSVTGEEDSKFENSSKLFRFDKPDESLRTPIDSWCALMDLPELKHKCIGGEELKKAIETHSDLPQKFGEPSQEGGLNAPHVAEMLFDEGSCELYDAVRPVNWKDPEQGEEPYDILVIGGGAGGLVTAAQSKGLGARVCLIERQFLGGDCLNSGCVPSKAFLKCCSVAHNARNAADYGVVIKGPIEIDFAAVMERMRKIRADISENDSAQRFSKFLGVDLYLGHAKFTGGHSAVVNGKELHFKKACIATGGRPFVPDIEGISSIKFHTSESIFNLTVQPKSMIILGCGPIGCELGQGFARLGTKVTMFEIGSQFLPREDKDCAAYLQEQMRKDGVTFLFETEPVKFEVASESGTIKHVFKNRTTDQVGEIETDVVLIAAGRLPNVEGLGCEAAGVEFDRYGIKVNEFLQTANEDIFAVGDCLPGPKFTHNSDVHARYVIRNALFSDRKNKDEIILPACTYTDPEIASVGMNEVRLQQAGIEYDVYTKFFDKCDRAICESRKGIYKVYCRKGTDEILGSTLVGGPAGDMICQITQAMVNGLGLAKLGDSVYPYPTFAESFGHLANFQFKPRYKLGPAENAIREGMREYKD